MTRLSAAKVALAGLGLLIWGYGARAELSAYQWAGTALVVAAFVLRFLGRDARPPRDSGGAGDAAS